MESFSRECCHDHMSGWSVLNATSNETNRRITEKGLALRRNLCPKCSILGYLEKTGLAQETNHRIALLRCHDHKSRVRNWRRQEETKGVWQRNFSTDSLGKAWAVRMKTVVEFVVLEQRKVPSSRNWTMAIGDGNKGDRVSVPTLHFLVSPSYLF